MLGGNVQDSLPKMLLLIGLFVLIIAAMVCITLARRIISLEQRQRSGQQSVRWGTDQLPLMLNQAGVIPVIFAQPVMVVMMTVVSLEAFGFLGLGSVLAYGEPLYRYLLTALIVFFTFFYFDYCRSE